MENAADIPLSGHCAKSDFPTSLGEFNRNLTSPDDDDGEVSDGSSSLLRFTLGDKLRTAATAIISISLTAYLI